MGAGATSFSDSSGLREGSLYYYRVRAKNSGAGTSSSYAVTSASTLGKATTAVRGVGRSMQQSGDVGRAEETVETYQKQLEDLNAQFKEEMDALSSKSDPINEKQMKCQ